MSFVVPFPSLPRCVAVFALGLSTLALVGCGGGGSSSVNPPSAPTNVQVTPQDAAVTLTWEGTGASQRRLASGTYFLRVSTETKQHVEKVVLVR